MKTKTTRKFLKANYTLVKIGYCDLQNTFNDIDPDYYTTRAEGWASDFYYLGNGVMISTGYDPTGSKTLPRAICEKYERKAGKIRESYTSRKIKKYETYKRKMENLRRELLQEVLAM